jgi:hypothetical protein
MNALIISLIAIGEAAFFTWLGTWKLNIPLTLWSAGSAAYWLFVLALVVCTIILIISYSKRFVLIPILLYTIVIVTGGILSSRLVNAYRYAGQLDVPDPSPFRDQDLPPFDPDQLPWVNESQAGVLGDKVLGQLGAIGSSVVIGDYTRQEVGGKLYLVAPILHKDFFSYSGSPQGTPGYIMVSMTSNDDVRLVTNIDGRDLRIKIQPAGHAAWSDKLERIVYSFNPSALTADWMFEIDDALHPYWVVPVYHNTIGWGGAEVDSILIVDAQSGEIASYDLRDVPEWVDRVQPVPFIEDQLANWGAYRGGYWNTWFGKIELLQSDPGNALVYRNGDCYVFDSLTSYNGADESTVGFVLVNLRTKVVQHFNLAGATEDAAQVSALGDERVKPLRYAAGFPLPVMVEGQPAYFFNLQDPVSRITKMFALVNIAKHQIVGVGNTIQAAKTDYLVKLRASGQSPLNTPDADMLEITGRVLRWGQYSRGGETYFNFILEGAADRILLTGADHAEAPLTQAGDRVLVRAMKTDESIWSVFFFDNLEFEQSR